MKKQEGDFLLKRDKVRHHLIMTRLGLKNQTYQKIMNQKSNGGYNNPLNDDEIMDLDESLYIVQQVIQDLRDDINPNFKEKRNVKRNLKEDFIEIEDLPGYFISNLRRVKRVNSITYRFLSVHTDLEDREYVKVGKRKFLIDDLVSKYFGK